MIPNVYSIENYKFTPKDRLFIDANVWIDIYGPFKPDNSRVSIYSNALHRIHHAQCPVYLDVLVLSEFINRVARIHFELVKDEMNFKNFKDFRRHSRFQEIAQVISVSVRKLLKGCKCIDSLFSTVDLNQIITEFETAASDFNDLMILEICRANELTLITHDADFHNRDVPILTANRKLLS